MPRSAVAGGCVDFVLPPAGIAREIGAHRAAPATWPGRRRPRHRGAGERAGAVAKILETVRKATGVDFTHYKAAHRSAAAITRRMVLHKIDGMRSYARASCGNARGGAGPLPGHPDPRDRGSSATRRTFEALQADGVPEPVQGPRRRRAVRVWVPGCSTGEEAYSLAISLLEFVEAAAAASPIQIFATDLNDAASQKARAGRLPEEHRARRLAGAAAAVLRRGGRQLPDQQDDPRHVRLRPAQRAARPAVLPARPDQLPQRADLPGAGAAASGSSPLLHYALKPTGFLMLGTSETSAGPDLFAVDRQEAQDLRAETGALGPPGLRPHRR